MKLTLFAPSTRVLLLLALLVAAACGSSEQSLCGELHDPSGVFCDSGFELVDLQSAEFMARREIGDDAVLFAVSNDNVWPMNPDGLAGSWQFSYRIPGDPDSERAWLVTVRGNEVESIEVRFTFPSGCTPEESLEPLDSRVVVPDAVRRLEQTDNPVRLGDTGVLSVLQRHGCWYVAVPIEFTHNFQNTVLYSGPGGEAILEYDDDDRFVSLQVE